MRDGTTRMLPKSRLGEFLSGLGMPVALPLSTDDGEIEFTVVEAGAAGLPPELALPYGPGEPARPPDERRPAINSSISPLKFISPQAQILWRYESPATERPVIRAPAAAGPLAIFGVRSCDVAAFRHQQRFFARPPAEDMFLDAASKLLLISVVCLEPGENCFCVCCDGGPRLEEGFDIQLTDLGDEYLFETGSAAGEGAARGAERFLSPTPANAVPRAQELRELALSRFTITSHMATGIRKVTSRRVPEEIWRRLAARCVECGGCAFVCPVCTCFDVADLCDSTTCGRRERARDCCQYAGYSREASGYNPRPDKVSRFRRRFHHKLSYFNLLTDGGHGCVGCGRCVQTCLGGVDMPAVVNALRTETVPASPRVHPEEIRA